MCTTFESEANKDNLRLFGRKLGIETPRNPNLLNIHAQSTYKGRNLSPSIKLIQIYILIIVPVMKFVPNFSLRLQSKHFSAFANSATAMSLPLFQFRSANNSGWHSLIVLLNLA